jgi:hypothetical protein
VRRLVVVGLGIPLLAVAVLGAVVLASDSGPGRLHGATASSPPPPAFTISTAVTARARSAPGMAVAAAANGGLWYQRPGGLLTRVAAGDGTVNYAFPASPDAAALAVSGRSLLEVAPAGAAAVLIVRDRGSGRVTQRIPLAGPPACTSAMPAGCAPVATGGQLLVPLANGLARVQGGTATLIPLPETRAVVTGARHAWVLTAGALLTIDPVTGAVRATAPLNGLVPSAIATAGGTVWVAGVRDGRPLLLRFDKPAGHAPLAVALPAAPTALAAADGAIWVGLTGGGVREFDPSRNALAGTSIDLPDQSELLTARPDQLWAVRIGAAHARFTRIDLAPTGS